MPNPSDSGSDSVDDIKKLNTVFKTVDAELEGVLLSSIHDDSEEEDEVSIDVDIHSVVTTTSTGEQKIVEIKKVEKLEQGKRTITFAKKVESNARGSSRQSYRGCKEITYNTPVIVESVRVGSFLKEPNEQDKKSGADGNESAQSLGENDGLEGNADPELGEQEQGENDGLEDNADPELEEQEQRENDGLEGNADPELEEQEQKSNERNEEQNSNEKNEEQSSLQPTGKVQIPNPQEGRNGKQTKTTTTVIKGTVEIKGKIRCTSPVMADKSPGQADKAGETDIDVVADLQGGTFTMHIDETKEAGAEVDKPVPSRRTSKMTSGYHMEKLTRSINEDQKSSVKSVRKYGGLDTEVDTNLEQSLQIHSSNKHSHDGESPLSSEPSLHEGQTANTMEKVHSEVEISYTKGNEMVENIHSEVDITYDNTKGGITRTKSANLASKRSERKPEESSNKRAPPSQTGCGQIREESSHKQVASSGKGQGQEKAESSHKQAAPPEKEKVQKPSGNIPLEEVQTVDNVVKLLQTITSKINVRVAEIMALHLLREMAKRKAQKCGQSANDKKFLTEAKTHERESEKERSTLTEIDEILDDICSKFK